MLLSKPNVLLLIGGAIGPETHRRRQRVGLLRVPLLLGREDLVHARGDGHGAVLVVAAAGKRNAAGVRASAGRTPVEAPRQPRKVRR